MPQVQLERARLKTAIERDYINGLTSLKELAVKHGRSVPSISIYLREMWDDWKVERELIEQEGVEKDHAVRMFGEVYRKAMDGYTRSQQNKEKVRTEYKQQKCEACKGTGFEGGEESGEWCEGCGGEGTVEVEDVTREVTGQAGDPGFLRVANDAIREVSRLKGLYPDRPKNRNAVDLNIYHTNIDVNEVDSDTILRAKLAELGRLRGKGRQVLDVEAKNGS